jgi:hypothetical protein
MLSVMPRSDMPRCDDVHDSLEVVLEAVTQSQLRLSRIEVRAGEIRQLRAEGRSEAEIVTREDGPLVVELLSETIALLHAASGPFRRDEARALHDEGVTITRIASLFGVTRQRVSEILQRRPKERPT